MRAWSALLVLFLIATVLAGCVGTDPVDERPAGDDPSAGIVAALEAVSFTPKKILDEVRAGGEPVIAVAPTGTLFVSAHPGWTHYHPSGDPTHVGLELVTPMNAQSYLWKSTDGGETWAHIGLIDGMGPRSTGFGVSDPDFTVMADGTVCYTDLEGLAMSSVSCSTDDGETWIGNPIASQRPNDRQWLASHGDELYFTANFFVDRALLVSTDRGLTWTQRGNVPCGYDLVADPDDGTLIVGCPDGIGVSFDGGATWERRAAPYEGVRRDMTEPAIDAAGNVWMVFATGNDTDPEHLVVAGSPDHGESWPWVVDLAAPGPGVRQVGAATSPAGSPHVWPWINAGSEGRLAVTWIGTMDAEATTLSTTDWHVFTALLVDAHTDRPFVSYHQVSEEPIHQRPICQSGTTCQVSSMMGDPAGDRRLGDFFEATLDLEGNLHIVVSDTVAKPNDVIAHVAYFRQSSGLALLIDGDRPATQG